MTTRVVVLFLATILLSSCASFKRKQSDEAQQTGQIGSNAVADEIPPPSFANDSKKKKNPYLGLTGYLVRPPLFVEPSDQAKFQRCSPVKIEQTQFHQGYARVFLRQGENTFAIKGLNRKTLTHKGIRIPLLDKYFLKRLDVGGNGRAVAVSTSKLREGQFAQQMPKKEFLFLSGDPDSLKKQQTTAGPVEELIYKGDGSAPGMTYYFLSGQLYSWKN